MIKKIGLVTSLFLLFSVKTVVAATIQPTIVIVNQVRGNECCDLGSISALEQQLHTSTTLHLPMTFALRFDALNDPLVTTYFTKEKTELIEPAVLLEVTPSLANASQVAYEGNTSHWYKARYAFLVGYTQDERKKIIDTAMARFKDVFGQYPKSTVAWMIDTWSLSYLFTKYGVTAHEMTREQFSLDSYTLYGGPLNTPYIPSKSYSLIPSGTKTQMPMIFRQTVTDPIHTYGDITSSYTSQANDYLSGERDLSYFENLLSSALFLSKPFGFALIGLETSMPQTAQIEFQKQLQLISKWRDEHRIQVQTMGHSREELLQSANPGATTVNMRTEEDKTAIWITTTNYRLRIIQHANTVLITDLRVFNQQFQDPYLQDPTVLANAYLVVPWLLDGSREFTHVEGVRPKTILHLANDFNSEPVGLKLPQANAHETLHVSANDPMSLSYQSVEGPVQIETLLDRWIVTMPTVPLAQEFTAQIAAIPARTHLTFGQEQSGHQVMVWPRVKDTKTDAYTKLPTDLLPVNASTSADIAKSILQYNNTAAVAGKNPIRLVLRLRDGDSKPVVLGLSFIETSTEGKNIETTISSSDETDGQYFIDVTSDTSQVFKVNLSLGHTGWTSKNLRFVMDCSNEVLVCVRQPQQFFWYLYTKITDRLREK